MNTYNIEINRGSTFSLELKARDEDNNLLDLSDYSGRAMLKFKYSDVSPLINFTTNITTPESGGLNISLTAAQTAELPVAKAFYDVEVYKDDGHVLKLLKGTAEINPEVTF